MPEVAITFAVTVCVTAEAVAVKNALVAPAATITVAGTDSAELLLDRLTTSPPAGAAALSDTVQLSVPAPEMVSPLQKSALRTPAAASPVPLRLITAVPFAGAFVVMVKDPLTAPDAGGSNFTCSVTASPGLSATGKPGPATPNPAPVTAAAEIVKGAVPEEVSVTNCGVAWVLTVTSPNARLLALRVSSGVPPPDCVGSSCTLNVAELEPMLAVIVALCAALTPIAIAVKVALLALAATATVAGTVTAESLLDKLTVSPLPPAAALSVAVQLSVPAPTMVAVPQVIALTLGDTGGGLVTATTPMPLSGKVIFPVLALVATVMVPAAVPAAAGLNCTFRFRVPAPASVRGSVF